MLSIEISLKNKNVMTQMRLTRIDIMRKKYLSKGNGVLSFLRTKIHAKLKIIYIAKILLKFSGKNKV